MSFADYWREISKAKDEYDRAIEPLVAALREAREKAWKRYLQRIVQAESFYKEDLV